jgi:hypothetical protein
VRGMDAASNVGDATCADSTAESIFTFTGFLPPIKMAGMRPRAGRTIPVKWKLTMTADGSPVIDPAFFVGIESYSVDCLTKVGDPSTAVVETSPGTTGLHHRGISKWRFNWKTPKSYAGSCRMMFLLLSDGSMSPTVFFKFR